MTTGGAMTETPTTTDLDNPAPTEYYITMTAQITPHANPAIDPLVASDDSDALEYELTAVKYYKGGDGSYQVSHHECWVDGAYATREAASRAPFVCPSWLAELWARKCPDPITESDLDCEPLAATPVVTGAGS